MVKQIPSSGSFSEIILPIEVEATANEMPPIITVIAGLHSEVVFIKHIIIMIFRPN